MTCLVFILQDLIRAISGEGWGGGGVFWCMCDPFLITCDQAAVPLRSFFGRQKVKVNVSGVPFVSLCLLIFPLPPFLKKEGLQEL